MCKDHMYRMACLNVKQEVEKESTPENKDLPAQIKKEPEDEETEGDKHDPASKYDEDEEDEEEDEDDVDIPSERGKKHDQGPPPPPPSAPSSRHSSMEKSGELKSPKSHSAKGKAEAASPRISDKKAVRNLCKFFYLPNIYLLKMQLIFPFKFNTIFQKYK